MHNLAKVKERFSRSIPILLVGSTVTGIVIASEHPPEADDPVITDSTVKTAVNQIETSSSTAQPILIEWLVQASVLMDDQPAAQALYAGGHKYYAIQDFPNSAAAFNDLLALAPGTLLAVEAHRMLAQISGVQSNHAGAIAEYELAEQTLDAITPIDPLHHEYSLLSFAPMMTTTYEILGDHAGAAAIAGRIVNEITIEPTARPEALRAAGRASFELGDMTVADTYYTQFLTEYPDEGWGNGVRIEAERRQQMARGMGWGLGYAREVEFCRDIIANPLYRDDPARYNIGLHLAVVVLKRGYEGETETILTELLDQAVADVDDALVAGDEAKRLHLKEHAEGALRFSYVGYLKAVDRITEANTQFNILASDPEYGAYSSFTATMIGLESPAP